MRLIALISLKTAFYTWMVVLLSGGVEAKSPEFNLLLHIMLGANVMLTVVGLYYFARACAYGFRYGFAQLDAP